MPDPSHPRPAGTPIGHDGLVVHSRTPFNAEPRPARLRAAFTTPQAGFYVRCHGEIPVLDPASYRLQVGGLVSTPLELGLAGLRERFPERRVVATMQCAGNRRADLQRVRPTSGDPWGPGAVGNAEWAGVRLADVLRAAGTEEEDGLHVAFQCADQCHEKGKSFRFEVSIPMRKALADEVLLAWAMNGEALTPEHGAPLRAVVPGWAGVRSAKWLLAVTVQDRPSDCPIQAIDYKLHPPDVTAATADPARGITIDALPLNSAVCEPEPHALLVPGRTAVRGYATASGRSVARVDVSADGGRTWTQAALEADPRQPWAWTFWDAALDLPRGEHELVVRAWDDAGQTQPALPDNVWNHRGYLSAAWHRVTVVVG